MGIKYDNNLQRLALRADTTSENIEKEVISIILKKDWITDFTDESWFGQPLRRIIPSNTYVDEVYHAIRSLGIDWILSRDFEAFLELRLLGDGDCPYCGGELEFSQDVVNVKILGSEYRCSHCHRDVLYVVEG